MVKKVKQTFLCTLENCCDDISLISAPAANALLDQEDKHPILSSSFVYLFIKSSNNASHKAFMVFGRFNLMVPMPFFDGLSSLYSFDTNMYS